MKKFFSLFLFSLLCCGVLKVQAALDPKNNNPIPTSIAVDLADLLVLQDEPVIADGSTSFAVKVGLYKKILNLVATLKEAHDIMYTDKIAPFITDSQDDQGRYHYDVVSGKADTLLGYSKCLSATKFRDVLCKNTSKDYTVDAQVDSNQESYVWVYLNSTNTPPQSNDRSASGYHYYQYVDDAEDYYDFYQTLNDPQSGVDDNFGGELWVGIKDDSKPTHDWTVTGNNKNGLTTYNDGGPATKVESAAALTNDNHSRPQSSSGDMKTDRTWGQWYEECLTTYEKALFRPQSSSGNVKTDRTWGQWWEHLTICQEVGVILTTVPTAIFVGRVIAADPETMIPLAIFGWAMCETISAFIS
ncbi:MAG: hypothetical protein K2W99_07800 [Chthoniobacterales bacterium]|nr:hypothetical protein [Chthoniobacterales bacterium]